MTDMLRMTRPLESATHLERVAFVKELRSALDQLGVSPGGGFVIIPLSQVDDMQLGPFQAHSDTSRKAALDNYPRQGSQRWRVLEALELRRERGGTRDELAEELSLPPNSVRPRLVELMQGGWVTGTDRTRPTATGSEAEVLVVTEKVA